MSANWLSVWQIPTAMVNKTEMEAVLVMKIMSGILKMTKLDANCLFALLTPTAMDLSHSQSTVIAITHSFGMHKARDAK